MGGAAFYTMQIYIFHRIVTNISAIFPPFSVFAIFLMCRLTTARQILQLSSRYVAYHATCRHKSFNIWAKNLTDSFSDANFASSKQQLIIFTFKNTTIMIKKVMICAAIFFCGMTSVQAQMMKASDLESYAKERYGDKWLDAAGNLAKTLTLDKNQGLTYQEVLQAPGKTKQQLYVALNFWATATFKDNHAITLNDKEAGCIIISSTIKDIAKHTGTLNSYSVSITPVIRLDIKDERVRVTYTLQDYDILGDETGGYVSLLASDRRTNADPKRKVDDKTNANLFDAQWVIGAHYPFVAKDAQKRTSAKALVMAHAYSNAIIDKVEETLKNGVVGESENW